MTKLPSSYLSIGTLTHERLFYPKLMWALPSQFRWDYVDHFERQVSRKVLQIIGGDLVSQTTGFNATHDVVWDTPYGVVDVEIKTTAKHSGYIEAGRNDLSESGLSASKSHLYLHISVNNPRPDDYTSRARIIKVRLYATWYLREKYMAALAAGKERVIPPSDDGPGSVGFDLNSFEDTHCWVGDFDGIINDYGDLIYDLTWVRDNVSVQRELRSIMIGVQKHDPHYTYEHKDFE